MHTIYEQKIFLHVLLLHHDIWYFCILLTRCLTSNVGISLNLLNVICDLNAFQCHSSVTNLVVQYLHNLDIITSNIIMCFYIFISFLISLYNMLFLLNDYASSKKPLAISFWEWLNVWKYFQVKCAPLSQAK